NINSLEILHTIHPKRLEVSTRSRGKDSGISPVLLSDWLNKRHNRELITSSILTFFSILPPILLCLLFSQFGWGSILTFTSAFSLGVIVYYFKLYSIHSIIFISNLGSWYGWKFMLMLMLISGFCLASFLYFLEDICRKRRIRRSAGLWVLHSRDLQCK
ncbi:MAG: hypothetical protein QG646_1987, partial [Euryarchaeota archaeon]|nr:hypothetical protein [Euryarchaeota archaeon]